MGSKCDRLQNLEFLFQIRLWWVFSLFRMHLKFPTRSLSGLDLAITVSEIIWVKRVKGANPKIIAFLIIILSPMYELFHWTQFLSGLYQHFVVARTVVWMHVWSGQRQIWFFILRSYFNVFVSPLWFLMKIPSHIVQGDLS